MPFRRPITDADLAAPMKFYEKGREDQGLRWRRAAGRDGHPREPKFLYRVEGVARRMRSRARSTGISDLELASRLSFFLWSQGPDEELLNAAVAGKLKRHALKSIGR